MSDQDPPANAQTGALPADVMLQHRYLIQRRLGQGGMGAVYLCHDTRLDIECAIKEMSTSLLQTDEEREQARKAFHEEAKLLARLSHPNLPRVSDHFTENGKEYLMMEYVPGETLGQIMRRQPPPWSLKELLKIAQPLTEVLHYLHTRKPPIIFRDLKPANVICTPEDKIKLIDFGIARLFKPGQSHDTQAFGTMGYSAPEQYGHGQTDARSDVYSLAVLLHQLATGFDPVTKPFGIPAASKLNPAIPQGFSEAIQHGMSHDPEERFGSMPAFWRALSSQANTGEARESYVARPPQSAPQQAAPYNMAASPTNQQQTYGPPTPQGGLGPGNQSQGYGLPSPQDAQVGRSQGYGPPPGQAVYGPPPGQASYGPPPGQAFYGPPPGQPISHPLQPGYGPPPAQPNSQPLYPAGSFVPPLSQQFGPPIRAVTTGMAKFSRNSGIAAVGLSVLILLVSGSSAAAGLAAFFALLAAAMAFILGLIALMGTAIAETEKGRSHATLGISLSLLTVVLTCVVAALVGGNS